MGRRQRTKNYWSKRKEQFNNGRKARERGRMLRTYEHIEHVHVDKEDEVYVVRYSAARWWLEELEKAGIKL